MKKILSLLLSAAIICLSFAASGRQYSDVAADSWYCANINEMSADGFLDGYEDGTFRPQNTITKAEFTVIAARMCSLSPASADGTHWASRIMQAALDKGWYDWDEIPPTAETYDEPITRKLAVKIVMKAFLPNASGDYTTESAKIKDFSALDGRYYNAVIAAYAAGIAEGDENGNFAPESNLTRAEACALLARAAGKTSALATPAAATSSTEPTTGQTSVPSTGNNGGVAENGHLCVKGTDLCNENGDTVVLHGMSSHGIQWFPQFLSKNVLSSAAESGADLFRAAMYTAENGYISAPQLKDTLNDAIDTALSLDMYSIIDWHILSDGNPQQYEAEAKEFFSAEASRYKGNAGVIYEICNEPNGNITWSDNVKPYAEDIISTIRAEDENALIIVGCPQWCQDLESVAADPINAENIMYTCHFYAGTHTQWLRDRIADVRSKGIPVFVSEWGMSDASGSGGIYSEESQKWLDFMSENNISWANWSLCDKNESSAAVQNGADISDGISYDELSESGKFVFSHFK
jgi:aryl-phospho-beta-D-glucosidase BglC (GH1 family)